MLKKCLLIIVGFGLLFSIPNIGFAQWQNLYDVLPDVPNCKTGTLKQSEKDKMLVYLNKIRDLHKLPHFEYDESFQDEAMEISLISVANGTLSHTPDQSYHCYSQTGYNGGISTNLYIAGGSNVTSESSVVAWMNDRNQIELGHRRWIVDPFVKKIAFGRVDGLSKTGGQQYSGQSFYYDSKTNQDLSSLKNDFVAVPYGDYPPSIWDFGWSVLSFSVIENRTSRWANNAELIKYASTLNGNPVNEAYVEVEDESGTVKTFKREAGLGWAYDGYGLPNYCYWQMHGLEQQKLYKVRVYDVLVNGQKRNFSYQFAFRDPFISKPGISVLSQPQDKAKEVNPNVTFQWGNSQGASFYILQIANDASFGASNIIYTRSDINKTSFQISGVLEPIKTYYWRIAGRNDAGTGEWSPIWSFTTTTAPDPPTIAGPANNATNVSMTPTLTWNTANKADKYQLQVSKVDDFSSTIVDKADLTATQYTLEKDILGPDSKYYWKVRSISNLSGPSIWSETRNFTTASAAPGKPDLLSPTQGQTDISAKAVLEWSEVPGAESYDLQVSPYVGYDPLDLAFDTTGLKTTKYQLRPNLLELETQYFWRVRAVGPGGSSDWSRNGRFTVGDATPVEDNLTWTNSIEIYPNPISAITTFDIEILEHEFVALKIFNNLGQQIETIFETEMRPGNYLINYDFSNMSNGVYYYQLIGKKTNISGILNVMN